MSTVNLNVADLRKTFCSPTGEPIEVLRGVFLSADAGELVAIAGASGAGKSTLLHLLGGLEAADGGTIRLGEVWLRGDDGNNNAPSTERAQSRFSNSQVGFVFQFHYLLSDLTAGENVALPLMIARLGRDESLRRATDALKKIGLGDRLKHRIRLLSGGEQQRVAVARALINEPKLVLADEPTGNLDASTGDEIGKLLVDYARKKKAVVIVATHNERMARACDRVLVLKDGSVVSST